jgi:uncharacterized RmlC-like cupin family protein
MSIRPFALLPFAAAAFLTAQTPPPIDNDQVRVITANDQPHRKSQPHEHKLNRVMIYLTAGTQDIITSDGKKTTLTFKAGDVKWSPASGTHTSEVTSDSPVTIVELEVKGPGDPSKKVTTPLDPLKVDPKDYKLEFENSQVRVVRVKIPAHALAPMHEHQLNRVTVYLTAQNTRLTMPDGSTQMAVHSAGSAVWGAATKHKEENLMDTPFEAILVEFK